MTLHPASHVQSVVHVEYYYGRLALSHESHRRLFTSRSMGHVSRCCVAQLNSSTILPVEAITFIRVRVRVRVRHHPPSRSNYLHSPLRGSRKSSAPISHMQRQESRDFVQHVRTPVVHELLIHLRQGSLAHQVSLRHGSRMACGLRLLRGPEGNTVLRPRHWFMKGPAGMQIGGYTAWRRAQWERWA